jgi:hypothetical protein
MIFTWSGEIPYGKDEIEKDAAWRYSATRADSLLDREFIRCCIHDCRERLPRRHRGQRPHFCPKHGISMSARPTYVYRDAERNFIIGRNIVKRLPKVENWRLGFETSEDALSWNVFVSLYALEGLAEAAAQLTGMSPIEEPELYLWGNRIGVESGKWERLLDARRTLEDGLTIPTEPDIILRIPGQAIVLIEAKFGSSNSRFVGKKNRFGSVKEFLNRYKCKKPATDPLNRQWISEQEDAMILEQLCRNAIFADWLASGDEQPFLINLVRRKATNDEGLFRQHLAEHGVQFRVHTWEDLCGLSVVEGKQASVLRHYLQDKTLNLQPAFNL